MPVTGKRSSCFCQKLLSARMADAITHQRKLFTNLSRVKYEKVVKANIVEKIFTENAGIASPIHYAQEW